MPERVKGAAKQARLGQAPVVPPPPRREAEPKLPDLGADDATVRNRPSSPQELLARMVERAKEAAEAAAKAAAEASGTSALEGVAGPARGEAAEASAKAGEAAVAGEAVVASDKIEKAAEKPAEATPAAPPAPAPQKVDAPAAPKSESGQAARTAKQAFAQVREAAGLSRGFLDRLWDGVKSVAGTVWTGVKPVLTKLWDGIKWIGEKTGITKGLQWLLPKIGDGFKWFQQKLQWAVYGVSFEEFKSRKIEDDPGDVNGPDFKELQKAKKEIPERAKAEQEALAKLSDADRKSYEKLAELSKDRPLSRWALQSMLLDGRLPGGKDLKGQGSVLDNLGKLATQDLAAGIKRADLVSDVIAEIENPVRINQQGKGTCVAATAQILLARRNQAEYARVIGELAGPSGTANLAGGDKLQRETDWADESDYGRSTSSRLIQPALMEMGMPLLDYDNTKDKHKAWVLPLAGGLMGFGSAKINEQLLGTDYSSHGFWHWNRDSQWNKLKKALEEGKGPLPCGVTWEDLGGHQLQIDKIENGKVYYTNPWGQRESMDEAEFKAHITNVEIPSGRKVG